MIKKYIKKHIPVEAVQWEGRPGNNTPEEHNFLFDKAQFEIDGEEVVLIVHTLEGDMKARPGDYIVKGVDGEFYPVKKEIFEKTYIEAKEDEELEQSNEKTESTVPINLGEIQSQEQFPFDDIPISDLTIPIPRPTTPELKWGFLKETLKVLIQEERSQAQKEAYQKILKIMDGFDGVA